MGMQGFQGMLQVFQQQFDDDMVDRMHYFVTSSCLVLLGALISFKQVQNILAYYLLYKSDDFLNCSSVAHRWNVGSQLFLPDPGSSIRKCID